MNSSKPKQKKKPVPNSELSLLKIGPNQIQIRTDICQTLTQIIINHYNKFMTNVQNQL